MVSITRNGSPWDKRLAGFEPVDGLVGQRSRFGVGGKNVIHVARLAGIETAHCLLDHVRYIDPAEAAVEEAFDGDFVRTV